MSVATSDNMIQLDGSHGEGGGQILRTALTLALLTGKGFNIRRIRANRDKPGLRPQHLSCVRAAAQLCDADVRGAEPGSRELSFRPGPSAPKDLTFDIGTAGSTALLLQTIHLPLALLSPEPVKARLIGGTFNLSAPSYPFIESTWKEHLGAMGLAVETSMPRAGFYPRGQGSLEVEIFPGKPRPISMLETGKLVRVDTTAGYAGLPESVAKRMLERVDLNFSNDPRLEEFRAQGHFEGVEFSYQRANWESVGPGAAVSIRCKREGSPQSCFVGLGERGKPAERVADQAFEESLAYLLSGGAVDPHSADQVLLPLALAEGRSEFSASFVTEHLRTNIKVVKAFLGCRISLEEQSGGTGKVTIDP